MALFGTTAFTLVTNIAPGTHPGQTLIYYFLAFNIAAALAPAFGMFLINLINLLSLITLRSSLTFVSFF